MDGNRTAYESILLSDTEARLIFAGTGCKKLFAFSRTEKTDDKNDYIYALHDLYRRGEVEESPDGRLSLSGNLRSIRDCIRESKAVFILRSSDTSKREKTLYIGKNDALITMPSVISGNKASFTLLKKEELLSCDLLLDLFPDGDVTGRIPEPDEQTVKELREQLASDGRIDSLRLLLGINRYDPHRDCIEPFLMVCLFNEGVSTVVFEGDIVCGTYEYDKQEIIKLLIRESEAE